MERIRLYIAIFLLSLPFLSCREIYYPDDIESNDKIPVIQGIIFENEAPVVKVYWALKYQDDVHDVISDAQVFISDDLGNFVQLIQAFPGTFTSFGEIYGMAGRTYTLKVIMPEGEFESSPQYLQTAPYIDSLYADPGTRKSYTYGSSGKPVFNDEEGLNIISDLSGYQGSTLYYRFETTVVKLSVYAVEIGTPAAHSIFLWETWNLDNSYSVDFSVTQESRQVLFRHPVGFLRYYYDQMLETPTSTAPFTESWVVTHRIYSISPDVYQYYNSVGRQLSGNDRIFAPVASQVKSNIQCTTDPSQKVIGVFEAASRTIVYKAFGWKDLTIYKSKELPWFPEVGKGSSVSFPPDFWVYF